MKYLMPRVYRDLLDDAKVLYDKAVETLNKKNIKNRSDTVNMFLSVLKDLFSVAGQVKLSSKLAIKEEPPRGFPSSDHYNSFIDALVSDVNSVYKQSSGIDISANRQYNYMKAYTKAYDDIILKIGNAVNDVGMISMKGDSKKTMLYRNEFNSKSSGDTLISADINPSAGVLRLASSETSDPLVLDNIENVTQNVRLERVDKNPYYGKYFGTISGGGDDIIVPEVKSDNWKETPIVNLFDDERDKTHWEAEFTMREDTLTHNVPGFGARWFMRASGCDEKLGRMDTTGRIYSYAKGMLVYQNDATSSDFFRNDSGDIIRNMYTTITIDLKVPQNINTLSIKKYLISEDTICGKHQIFVNNIEMWDGASLTNNSTNRWDSIPQFSGRYTNTTSTTKPARVYKADGSTTGQRSRITSGLRNMPQYDNTDSTPSTIGSIKTEATPTVINSSNASSWSSMDSWTFPNRLVKSIRITLYTDSPYKIRYTMTRHEVLTSNWVERKFGGVDKSWLIYQHSADTISKPVALSTKVESKTQKDIISKNIVIGAAAIGGLPAISLLIDYIIVKEVWKIAVDKLFKDSSKVDTTIRETVNGGTRVHNIDPVNSDLYRWSIELSDISASGEKYMDSGSFTSDIYGKDLPKKIDRISLFSNHNYNGGDILYYIVPDGGFPIRIQPMEETDEVHEGTNTDVPKILYVNSGIPDDDKDDGRWGEGAYIYLPNNTFRVMIVIKRKEEDEGSTPEISSYVVKIKYKDEGGEFIAS